MHCKTAIEEIKTKWILFGLFLQCGYHLNALTNIGLWTLRFNGCWITSGPDRVTTFLGRGFSTFAALKPVWGPIYLLYCLLRWSNWIPSAAYNESLQCFFSPHECLFSLNAGFSLITRLNPKNSHLSFGTSHLSPFLLSFFNSSVTISLIPAEDYRPAFMCLSLRIKARRSGLFPHSANWLLIWWVHFKVEWESWPAFKFISGV